MNVAANIKFQNKRVGAVYYDNHKGFASLEFERSFLQTGFDLAPLKMPAKTAAGRIFNFPGLRNSATFKGMPGLLADVLPDKYGNAIINAWLTKNGRPSFSLDPVETLCFIGKRGMGALEFEPVVPKVQNTAHAVELNSLIQVARDILSDRKDFTANMPGDEEKAMLDILQIGTSAGGARAKAIIAYNPMTKEIKSGQAAAPTGFSHWLIKFDGVHDSQFGVSSGFGRVEMAYYYMAKDCGIEMTECMLLEENNRAHFMTRRFDRPNEKDKLHVQTFCAMQHYDFMDVGVYSYEQLFETMRILGLPYPQMEQLYRRMIFNVLSRNCDDHTKNFAFLMDEAGNWRLSPAYDVCHAYRPGSTWVSKQNLTVNGKREQITRPDFIAVAAQASIKKANHIVDELKLVIENWQKYASQTMVEDKLKAAIHKTIIDQILITQQA